MNKAGFPEAGYLKAVYYQNRSPEGLEYLTGNICQRCTGVRDDAPSLQFLKGASALQKYTIVCDKIEHFSLIDFLRFTLCWEYED